MNKYRNKKTEVEGIVFDSKKEAKYYLYLKQLLDKDKIENLQRQVVFELVPAIWKEEIVHLKTKDKVVKKRVQRPITYIADFVYIDKATGNQCVIDCKGMRTKEYRLKAKMMYAFKGIQITEV